ncbi:P-loop containing nucleoside triphosphate hydrolase protein [Aspergillus granulosus]|uniref:P-loop containing nucleoside triphosphate hydrolase protein n=1 Tax=Aspergillus granulosus TaxID=176169 RepID=A0ABR4HGK7_9EURO
MPPKTISRVVVIGDHGVGKTNLINQFINERIEDEEYKSTIGIELYRKPGFRLRRDHDSGQEDNREVKGKESPDTVNFEIIECRPSECVNTRRDWVYARMSVIVAMYSVTSILSLKRARSILAEARKKAFEGKVFLVGILADAQDQREVTREDGGALAREFGVDYSELSVRDAAAVEDLFQIIARFAPVKEERVVKEDTSMWGGLWKGFWS